MPNGIKRGEIYWLDWSPGGGSEQIGKRPALVIQNDTGNEHGKTTIVAACSTAPKKQYPFIVFIAGQESGLPKNSSVNLAMIMTIEKSRLIDKAGELNEAKMAEVDIAIKNSLSLS